MQNSFQERPIPLIIRNQAKKYQANPEALQFFASIKGKIALISVAGIYRTGKSYLLNTILLNRKNGFAVGPTTNPKTKGIWVWGKPLTQRDDKNQIVNVCVLDSEGLGSTEEDINHDLRLFSITLLLSSTFLYNTMGAVDENAIDSLGLVLRLCEHLKSQNYNDFPDFYWILRDFSLALVGKDNNPLTTKMYLENCLSNQTGQSEIRNKIRNSIRSAFTNRNCITLVRPLTDQSSLQNLDNLDLDELRPEFVEQVIQFRKTILSGNIKTKKIKGKEITSEMLIQLIKIYVNEINGEKLPVIETGWKYVCKKQCEGVLELIQNQAQEMLAQLSQRLPTTKRQLKDQEEKIFQHLKKLFQAKTLNNDQAQFYLPELQTLIRKKVKKIEEDMKTKNGQETKAFIKKQFEYIERKAKQNEFKNMGELVKQFEAFYDFYRKKCPYKDEIQTGLQFLMKKFSDCSLIMFKNMKNKKDSEITKLKEDLEKITTEFVSKEQKYKSEKTNHQDKLAILQSKIEELVKQNKSMTEIIVKNEEQIQNLKLEKQESNLIQSEQMQYEVIALRKKILEADDNLKEYECQKMMELNNLKNIIELKDNEINHFGEDKKSLTDKLTAITSELSVERKEKQSKVEDLIAELEKTKEEIELNHRNYQEKISTKDSLISKLENCIESKSSQLENISQQHQKTLKTLLESFDQERTQMTENYKEQIKTLKETMQNNDQTVTLKVKKAEAEFAQKQMDLKMHKLEIDKEKAILSQKIEFLKKQCEEKEEKIAKLLIENNCYLSMFEEKDNQLSNISLVLDDLRNNNENNSNQLSTKIQELNNLITEKVKQINRLESENESHENSIRQKNQFLKINEEKIKAMNKNLEEKIKQMSEKLNYEIQNSEKARVNYESEIDTLKSENTKAMEDQKRNAQLSLVQLKNYYAMENQRLQKRILEDRKKHEYSESNSIIDLDNKHRKQQRLLQEEISQLKLTIQSLEEQLTRVQNQCESKIMNQEDEKIAEIRMYKNKYDTLQKKHDELSMDMAEYEKTNEQERITLVKKIEATNFELSRKEKELMQAISKREYAEASIVKKETQIENVKRLMNQEIQSGLKKVVEVQTKYQKLNQQYMQVKIQSEKQIALSKQRNQFLTVKLADLTKEKEIGSSKNLQKIDKQKINELKEQVEKYKAELMSFQAKSQSMRKANKESDSNLKKQIMNLEKENQYLVQKNEINQSKLSEIEIKVTQKNEQFSKDHEENREKYQLERSELQKEMEEIREKLVKAEDERSEASWKLQKEVALLNDKIKYVEYQRDQAKKDLEENQKRLNMAFLQLKKTSDKANEESENKKNVTDKKHVNQLDVIKESMRIKHQENQESIKKQRQEIKQLKEKNIDLTDKLHRSEKAKTAEKNLQEENEVLRREKENLMMNYRSDRTKESEEWKRKLAEAEKKNKEIERMNNNFTFTLEKEQTKWNLERQNLMERVKHLEDAIEWEKNRNQMGKSKLELKKSDSSSQFQQNTEAGKYNWK